MTTSQRIDSAYSYADLEMFREAWQEMQAVAPQARDTRGYLMLVTLVAPALGKWHDAAEANRRLVRLEPDTLLHWMSWGLAVRHSLGPLAAADIFAAAMRHNPETVCYPYNYAAMLCEAGRIGEARCVLYSVLHRHPPMRENALDDERFEAIWDMFMENDE